MASGSAPSGNAKVYADKISLLETSIAEAEKGPVTNAKKLEALLAILELVPSLAKPEVAAHQGRLEDQLEQLLVQNATEPLRRQVAAVECALYFHGDSSTVQTFFQRLLKLADQSKKAGTHAKVAALDVAGSLLTQLRMPLEMYSTEVFVTVAKHMKFTEASVRVSALQCLCKGMSEQSLKIQSNASNIWKMLQKTLVDKAVTVRTASAHALTRLAAMSAETVAGNWEAMVSVCLRNLSVPEDGQGAILMSECRYAFAKSLAQVLATMTSPAALGMVERSKKKPGVSSFSSAVEFLEQAALKGPGGQAFVPFRGSLCIVVVELATLCRINDSASVGVVLRMLLSILDAPPQSKGKGVEEELLPQLARYVSGSMLQALELAEPESRLIEVMEQTLVPLIAKRMQMPAGSALSKGAELRTIALLEALSKAIVEAREHFPSIESKVLRMLTEIVGTLPSATVQLHTAYCLRTAAFSSPPQLFQLLSVLMNLVTVQNAELLGAPVPKPGGSKGAGGTDLQPLIRGLFGYCTALAALVAELFRSSLGVPHDVTSAVLGAAKALLDPHPSASVSAQRRCCAFILLEGLMSLGAEWVGQRLTTLFSLWKMALGKKPVDRARVLYQQDSSGDPNGEGLSACREELLALLCALRSLYAFTQHCHETLLTSLPHLHKILVVFLTNVSQLTVTLPHPTSANLRAKYQVGSGNHLLTLSQQCGIPDILLMIRAIMYQTFAAMQPTQYSSRFVPLLNMLADDVTRPVSNEFATTEFAMHFLNLDDSVVDLADPYIMTGKDAPAVARVAATRLLMNPTASKEQLPPPSEPSLADIFNDSAAACCFSGPPLEGPASIQGMLTPWDAWLQPSSTMASQSTSAEWDWRSSAVSLLASIMNSSEVNEAPRSAVLQHLLKKCEGTDEPEKSHSKRSGAQPAAGGGSDTSALSSLAVVAYLREYARGIGGRNAAPVISADLIMQRAMQGLKEANPVVRRLHVETLGLLFYIHHQVKDSPLVPQILRFMETSLTAESSQCRSGVALLCGVISRTFAAFGRPGHAGVDPQVSLLLDRPEPKPQRSGGLPHLASVMPLLLKLGKDTTQPVRLWMFRSLQLVLKAAGAGLPVDLLKDALRLTTAHMLGDFFESPLVMWVISELVQSAAVAITPAQDPAEVTIFEENVTRLVSLWKGIRHVHYKPGPITTSTACALVRTEAMCLSAVAAVFRVSQSAKIATQSGQLAVKMVRDHVGGKLALPGTAGSSASQAVRTAAAQAACELLGNASTAAGVAKLVEPGQVFELLDNAQGTEEQAMQRLLEILIEYSGLTELPMWMQTLKEVVLAITPKRLSTKDDRGGQDDEKDTTDDAAGLAGNRSQEDSGAPDSRRHHQLKTRAKAFAVACVRTLLERAAPDDTRHFQVAATPDMEGKENCMVHYLDTFIALAAHASSSEDPTMAENGLRLMLLVVSRFKNTHDEKMQMDDGDCPLLLIQYEAQVSSCIRHNLRPKADPVLTRLGLELLLEVLVARASNSTRRLVELLIQPFTKDAFEPDPLYCESVSTRSFVYRLHCVCDLLDSDLDEPTLRSSLPQLSRWIQYAVRDAAVLLSALSPQSIKTYQPMTFSLTDYKVVQPCLRQAVPTIFRGICVLCRATEGGAGVSREVCCLTLGSIVAMLSEGTAAQISDVEIGIFLRTIREVLTVAGADATSDSSSDEAVIGCDFVLDLLATLWRQLYEVPARRALHLPGLVALFHMLSESVAKPLMTDDAIGKVLPWQTALRQDSEAGQRGRAAVGGYAFLLVSTALHSPSVTADQAVLSQVLDIFSVWLTVSLRGLPRSSAKVEPANEGSKDSDEVDSPGFPVAAAAPGADEALWQRCAWLWLPFLSPFPSTLAVTHAALTLKYWKVMCTTLGAEGSSCGAAAAYLAYATGKLAVLLGKVLGEHGAALPEAEERRCVCFFAMLVPAISALCQVFQASGPGAEAVAPAVSSAVAEVLAVLSKGLQSEQATVLQTTVSSLQTLLRSQAESLLEHTVRILLQLILCFLKVDKQKPDSLASQLSALATWLVQVARSNPEELKVEVSKLGPEEQQSVQQLMRDHLANASRLDGRSAPTSQGTAPSGSSAKIELKMKF